MTPAAGLRRGLFLAPFDALASAATMAQLAALAEDAGWDGLFVWDHLLYDGIEAIADPWICLAAMAAATRRLTLGPMVTPLARRRPQIVARQAATLAGLAPGRTVLGFGLGDDGGDPATGVGGELSGFGDELDPRRRGSMLTEGLDVLTELLSGETVRHRGEHYVADGIAFAPSPSPSIPIWLAARWPHRAPVRRAAGHDGLFTIGLDDPAQLGELRDEVMAMRAGGDGERAPFQFVVHGSPGDDPAPWAAAGATWYLTQLGPHELELGEVRAAIEAGPGTEGGPR